MFPGALGTVALRLGLCFAAIAALAAAPAQAERRVALVIGNSAYAHVPSLANPGRDATAIGEALRRLQFEHVTVLKDLSATALRKALLDFEPQAAGADIAVVYFAGHGIEVDGQNFLIPIDARLARTAATELEAIPLSTVTTVLGSARKLRLVILDACRDNPFRPRMAADSGRKRSIGRGLSRVEPGDNELIVYAAAAGTEAADGSGLHSPFTAALLTHIEAPGLDVRIMLGKVRDEVLAATGRQQAPHIYGTLGGEQIWLAAPGAAGKPAQAVAPAVAPALAPSPPQALPSPAQRPLYFGPPGAWVKLCEKGTLTGKDTEGREQKKAVDLCMTLHEQIHPDTGLTMVAARLSQTKVDGQEKAEFSVTVPQGVALASGLAVTVLPPDLWEKVQRKEKLEKGEEARLRPMKLNFANCTIVGCIAETDASPDFLSLLRSGAGFIVQTVRTPNTPVAQPVPLAGFNQALMGPPTDTKKFTEARTELMQQIARRQQETLTDLKKQQEKLNRMQRK